MANQNASLFAARAATPQSMVRANQNGGALRCFFATFTNPASGGVATTEHIKWGTLPIGARVVGGYMTWSTGTASCTLNLGDPATPTRYAAATAVTTAGTLALTPPATNALGLAGHEVAVAQVGAATDQSEIRSVCAGAVVAAGQTITLCLFYVTD